MKKRFLPFLILVLISMISCQKENSTPGPVSYAKATPVLVQSEYYIDGKLTNWSEYKNGKLDKLHMGSNTYLSYEYDEVSRVTSEFYNDPFQKNLRSKSYYDDRKRVIKKEHFFSEAESLVTEYIYQNEELKYVYQRSYKSLNGIPTHYSSLKQTFYYFNRRLANIETVVDTYENEAIINTETRTSYYEWHNPNSYTIDGLTTIEYSANIKAPYYFNDVSSIADEFTDKEIRARVLKFSGPYRLTSKSMLEIKSEVKNEFTITLENIIVNEYNFPLEYSMVVKYADGRVSSSRRQYKYIDLTKTY